ncbi:transposon Ty3-I Gag-Pol polyprotein [Trichonephila inaurata madagascariensis]|uniref:Transposon Ty3-I Gag-Pol polyprotein n=1 Tax=Trichonephila inaurata madagascariensis TaxID=2747483 RepID=A0A8X6Y4W8_9ARAC|nr:transposon Ty3-I Gag-Pol polyprotein [Trichonephila inaurata madagascariensis]
MNFSDPTPNPLLPLQTNPAKKKKKKKLLVSLETLLDDDNDSANREETHSTATSNRIAPSHHNPVPHRAYGCSKSSLIAPSLHLRALIENHPDSTISLKQSGRRRAVIVDRILPFVTFAHNIARQDTTGFTPFFLTFGLEAETTLDAMFREPIEYTAQDFVARLVTQAEESRQLARIRTLEAQEKDRLRYNSRHRVVLYQPGDLVFIYIPVLKVGHTEKLLQKYFGQYQVLRKLSDVAYEVHDFDPTFRRRKSKGIVLVLRMKPYYDLDLQAHFNDSVASDDRRFGEITPSTGRNDYTVPQQHAKD